MSTPDACALCGHAHAGAICFAPCGCQYFTPAPKPEPSAEALALARKIIEKDWTEPRIALAIDAHTKAVSDSWVEQDLRAALAKKDEALRGTLAYIEQSHDIGDHEAWVIAAREALGAK